MFQIIDALEGFEKNFSKKFLFGISEILGRGGRIVLSFSARSLSRDVRIRAEKKWLLEFLNENFKIIDDFEMNDERFVIFKLKK